LGSPVQQQEAASMAKTEAASAVKMRVMESVAVGFKDDVEKSAY
jgi:hypothetical protein